MNISVCYTYNMEQTLFHLQQKPKHTNTTTTTVSLFIIILVIPSSIKFTADLLNARNNFSYATLEIMYTYVAIWI